MIDEENLMIFTDTIFGEARGEYNLINGGMTSLIAVGCVIRNRLKSGKYGKTYIEVCKAPLQFSCWNKNDPNLSYLQSDKRFNDPAYNYCKIAANLIVSNESLDLTKGSLNYYADSIAAPKWASKMKLTFRIGRHIFFS